MKHRHKILLLVLFFITIHLPIKSYGQQLNYKLVSVYLYNFIKFIKWPDESASKLFVIGVYSQDAAVLAELSKIANIKTTDGKNIIIKKISSFQEAQGCQMIYIDAKMSKKTKEMALALKNLPILIVGGQQGLIAKGASIAIFVDEDDDYKTKFELSRTGLESKGIKASSQLMQLAVLTD